MQKDQFYAAASLQYLRGRGHMTSNLSYTKPIFSQTGFLSAFALYLTPKIQFMQRVLLFLFFVSFIDASAQKQISLSDIYRTGTFRGEYVPAVFESAKTAPVDPKDLVGSDGKTLGRPDDVQAAPADDNLHLVKFQTEPIYRHSSKSYVYLYNTANKKLLKLAEEKVLHPQFSPQGKHIAYVKDNNLYIYDIASNSSKAITTDGKWNHIINGNCDWVYEEEFSFTQAYQWSPKGDYIAYYKFDETKVKEYSFTEYNSDYNHEYRYKYPKAGEDNSKVTIHIYNVNTGKTVPANYEQGDIYIPRIKWTKGDKDLVVFWMNRHQNHLKLLQTNADNGSSALLYEEKNKYYIDIHDDWYFMQDQYLFTSEMNGYNQLYMYGAGGKRKTLISNQKFDVVKVDAVDEANKLVYYTLAYPTPMERTLFVTDFGGKKTTMLTPGGGYHNATFNDNKTAFYDHHSSINTPQRVTLNSIVKKGDAISVKQDKLVTENAALQNKMKDYQFGKAEFLKIANGRGDEINGWMLKPANFSTNKKYPVLFCNYGGPGSQSVADRFGSASVWHQLLAQKGFIVVAFDNTGTGYRGETFKKKTYLQLGKYEIEDQIAAAKWLAQQPYVDAAKIGHWGWSFGGFMSSLAITKGADVFSAAVAVAPVTNWRFYDNIYTERYMRTPKENVAGYDENSPIFFTDKIKGKYLIIHGTADDNVHFQNATQMVTALVKNNIPFESGYYPNKNHSISGYADNTSIHLWTKMTNWILQNLGNENTDKTLLK